MDCSPFLVKRDLLGLRKAVRASGEKASERACSQYGYRDCEGHFLRLTVFLTLTGKSQEIVNERICPPEISTVA